MAHVVVEAKMNNVLSTALIKANQSQEHLKTSQTIQFQPVSNGQDWLNLWSLSNIDFKDWLDHYLRLLQVDRMLLQPSAKRLTNASSVNLVYTLKVYFKSTSSRLNTTFNLY